MASAVGRVCTRVVSIARADSNTAAVIQTIGIRFVLLFMNFGTGIIIARSLGPVGRGEQAAIALWPLLLATLATLGIPTALRYETRRQPQSGPEYYAASFLITLVMGVVAGVVGALIMPLLLHGYHISVIRTAQAFMLFAPLELLGLLITAQLEAVGNFRRSILNQLNQTMVILLALIVLRISGHITPVTAALSYTVPCTAQTLWLAIRLWPQHLNRIREMTAKARALLHYGLRSYGTDVINALASQLDLAVIVLFLSATNLGLYTVALTLSRLLKIVHTSLVSVIFPRASGLASDERIALVTRAARLSTLASIVLGAFFLLTIPIVLPRLYGEEFRAAIPLMPLLTAEAILGGLGLVLNQSFLSSGRPFIVTMIEGASIACAIVLLVVLVPRMNILGAATALLCTAVIRLFFIMTAYGVVLRRPIPKLLPDAEDLAYVRFKISKPFPTPVRTIE